MKVLVIGAGIAGPVFATTLRDRLPSAAVTIVERAATFRSSGQTVEINGAAYKAVEYLGHDVMTKVKELRTLEKGLVIVDEKNRWRAKFPMIENGKMNFTSEVEILRADLAKIFTDIATEVGTDVRFNESVKTFDDRGEEGIFVTFATSGATERFDVVIGADGLRSRTRRALFTEDALHSLGIYVCYFNFENTDRDKDHWWRWYNTTRGRQILMRPDRVGKQRGYFGIMPKDEKSIAEFANHTSLSMAEQKALWRKHFTDAGWDVERFMEEMDKFDDFYMHVVGQVKMPKWSKGRVALVGDAAYCPSQYTGVGNTLAIVGAYILAGELAHCNEIYQHAFDKYEERMRPYIDEKQQISPYILSLAHAQTSFGVKAGRTFLSIMSKSKIVFLLNKFGKGEPDGIEIPVYPVVQSA